MICAKCQQDLPEDSFYKDSRKSNGVGRYCKECSKTYTKDWFKRNKSRWATYIKARYVSKKEVSP